MPLRARTKTACAIARIEPTKLNEAISLGALSCAPETRPGAARIFERDEIVMLCIFAVLIDGKLNTERAGWIACWAFDEFRWNDAVEVVTVGRKMNGAWHTVQGDNPQFPIQYRFDVTALRTFVDKELAWHRDNQVVGD